MRNQPFDIKVYEGVIAPKAKTEDIEGGAKLIVTDKYGTTETVIYDGETGPQGEKGEDAKINGKNAITIEQGDNIVITDTTDGIQISAPSVSDKVSDVQIDGVSVVTDNVANINSSEFCKVKDVTVNGTSVVDNATAKVTVPTKQSDLTNDDHTVKDAQYKHITVTDSSVSDGTNTFNQYVLPDDVIQDSDYKHIDVSADKVTDGINTLTKGIFTVNYRETKYSDIYNAYKNGQIIVCTKSVSDSSTGFYYTALFTATGYRSTATPYYFVFSATVENDLTAYFTVNSNNSWSNPAIAPAVNTVNGKSGRVTVPVVAKSNTNGNIKIDNVEVTVYDDSKKQADLTTITGYNASAIQTLKNIRGELQWVTEE